MSTAEKIFKKAQGLPKPAQTTLLQIVESLAAQTKPAKAKPQFGSAKGLIQIGPEFDAPLDDFKPCTE